MIDARTRLRFAAGLLIGAAPAAVAAQATAPAAARPAPAAAAPDDPYADPEDITVVARRQPGAVIGDIPPEEQLGPADIRAYGVSSIADLLDELAPQTGSVQGRGGEAPVVLLNGRRISSFAEIRDIPTEAILRVDILPEEVALKYGFGADQKLVNIVLRRRFRAFTGEAGGGLATEGGGANGSADADLLRIHGDGRFHIDARYQQNAALTEAERNLRAAPPGAPYSYQGNIAAAAGMAEIDPALSTLAGRPVTVAPVPATALAGRPALADFLAGANQPGTSDIGDSRTLKPASKTLTLNSVYSRTILGDVAATINGTLALSQSDARLGPATEALAIPAGNPSSPFADDVTLYRYLGSVAALGQRVRTLTGHLGFSLNGGTQPWRWTATGNADHSETRTRTDRGYDLAPFDAAVAAGDPATDPFAAPDPGQLGGLARDRARAIANTGNLQALASGPLLSLPAGPVSTTVTIGGTLSAFSSTSTRAGLVQSARLSRDSGSGRINLDLPIASRRKGVLSALGELSVNGNLEVSRYSGFGTLRTFGYGLNWSPVAQVRLIASFTDDEGVPTVQQLANPVVATPDVRVFDYVKGATVDVTQLSGGNRALANDDRRVRKLGLTLKPFTGRDLTLTATYVGSRIRNAIASLPAATAAIEQAFPDRFVRDADGDLTRIDVTPVNFARETRDQLRLGFNLSVPLKSSRSLIQRQFNAFMAARHARDDTPPPGDGARAPEGRPGGGGGGGHGGGFGGFHHGGGGSGGWRGGRVQFALYDTWTLRDTVLIRPGVPVIDLLDGGTLGSGGQPRHAIQAQIGYANNGLGARLEGNYQTATRVDAGPGGASGALRFSALATINFRLFANLSQLPPLIGRKWALGSRLTFSVTNLFDSRQRVRDALGDTPVSYQPAYLDPLGRTIRISFRKLFFSRPPRGSFRH